MPPKKQGMLKWSECIDKNNNVEIFMYICQHMWACKAKFLGDV